ETAGLWRDTEHVEPLAPRRGKPRRSGSAPIVLIPTGEDDADFIYATGFGVETGLYIRYADKEDVLIVSPLEIDRARAQSRVSNIVEDREAYVHRSWARLAARLIREKGMTEARVSPNLRAVRLEDMRTTGPDAGAHRQLREPLMYERQRRPHAHCGGRGDQRRGQAQARGGGAAAGCGHRIDRPRRARQRAPPERVPGLDRPRLRHQDDGLRRAGRRRQDEPQHRPWRRA